MMPQERVHVGIDVSQKRLDVWVLEEALAWQVGNDAAGWNGAWCGR
jgi:hypothetical protein